MTYNISLCVLEIPYCCMEIENLLQKINLNS